MHPNTILAASGVLAASSQVLAAPQSITQLLARQDDWDYIDDEDGNTRIRISDNKINFGNTRVRDVVESISDECTDVSCGSGGNDWELETRLIDDNYLQWGRTINVHADGSFANDSPGTRDELVDMAVRVLEEFAHTVDRDYTDVQDCHTLGGTRLCESLATGDTQYAQEDTEHWCPDEIHIRVDNDNGHGTLDITFEVSSGMEDGVCQNLADIGGAIAGAVGAPTASLFSLFGLGCT